jgi:hypothetical protein
MESRRFLLLLMAVIFLLVPREVPAQEQNPDQPARYHLIQLVDPATFLERVNDTARQGYRLIAMKCCVGWNPCGHHEAS